MRLKSRLLCASILATVGAAALPAGTAAAQEAAASRQQMVVLDIPAGPASTGLNTLATQADVQIFYPFGLVSGRTLPAIKGEYSRDEAIRMVAEAAGLSVTRQGDAYALEDPQSGSASDGAEGTVEALIVTAQKREEDIQDVPIAISAFTQEDLTRSQVAGGPDLMTQVPNFTFTKTNFSSYSIQIRGIGTQAISATTDAAVAVAFNNTPFIRNRFFEQEFYDLQRVEVLRGPQGTLYGRNATAGVVNIISAKPSFNYEAKLSGDVSNYNSTRLEGMINIPLVEDAVALRLAGAWTKRDGFVTNEITGNPIDGRDLWSTRVSLRVEPTDAIRANLIWEHFEEDDDRLRSGKQLCKKDVPTTIGGIDVAEDNSQAGGQAATFSQGCTPTSLYSPDAFQTPYGYALPYYGPLSQIGLPVNSEVDPYVSTTQSRDLRVIESTRDPEYRAKTDLAQLLLEVDVTPSLTLVSETAYSTDFLFSTQDFNRFNTREGAFFPNAGGGAVTDENGVFCDPQLGCSSRLVLADLSTAKSRHFSQELRLSSDFNGPINGSMGLNFLRYDTEDKYFVFINSLSLWSVLAWDTGIQSPGPYVPGVSDNHQCLDRGFRPGDMTQVQQLLNCIYIDPNPIHSLNDQGHNYFLSRNPYRLISYAAFGELYYRMADNLKLTAGLRWTVDKKRAPRIPSWLIAAETYGYPVLEVVEQDWTEPTGRLALDWKPDLAMTDETLLYVSYAKGYKAGGMNPPPTMIATYGSFNVVSDDFGSAVLESMLQPKTFDAEFVNAFEVGAKNTLLDGRMTFNANAFYYDYESYQLSQIINRSAVTQNFDAEVWGLEIEADWRPLENLRLGFKGGYENTRVADGMQAIDIMDRTAGDPNWVVSRPFPSIPSNCILPVWLVTFGGQINIPNGQFGGDGPCVAAYLFGVDPVTLLPYKANPTEASTDANTHVVNFYFDRGYEGFNPKTAPNNGEGIFKNLSGNELPNAPHFTATLTADYTIPLPQDWLATLHTDLYYQSEAWTRIFNTEGYDKLKAYTNVNLAAIFTNEGAGWKVMAYVKNVFDRDSITGAFLNSDDTGLTTNVFLTEPRLYGLRVTKEWTGASVLGGFLGGGAGPNPVTVTLGGGLLRTDAPTSPYVVTGLVEPFFDVGDPLRPQAEDLDWGDSREVGIAYRPASGGWLLSGRARFGKTNGQGHSLIEEQSPGGYPKYAGDRADYWQGRVNYVLTTARDRENHVIVDFDIGKDVGLGIEIKSTLAFGLRYAQFKSETDLKVRGVPDYYMAPEMAIKYPFTDNNYITSITADRQFTGGGPALTWDASKRFLGDDEAGHAAVDWTVSGAVLFGRQKSRFSGETEVTYTYARVFHGEFTEIDTHPIAIHRSDRAIVPAVSLGLGLSYEIERFKVGAGYYWERYFDAIDGGVERRRTYDRTIDGPYFKLSVGFGG